MTYSETLDYLFSQVPMFQNQGAGAYKPGLDTTLALAQAWGNPQDKIKAFIHVGGTNGKGSTAHTIAAILQSAGYRTALYTSPHLVDFRERIRVDGEMIPEAEVVDFVEKYRGNQELVDMHPTFFELTTIMALDYFARKDVDVAVIEVGLGGRLDCTNIIMPKVSIITNISLDHTALLGNTDAEIACEKAGIIKPGVPVVIGNAPVGSPVREVFVEKAHLEKAPIYFAQEQKITRFGSVAPELKGDCQAENTATILCAIDIISRNFDKIDTSAVQHGFANVCRLTGLKGRWMVTEENGITLISDTGHNIGGWGYLGPRLCSIPNLRMVVGFVNDKDVNAIMATMPKNAEYYFVTPSVQRGKPSAETAAVAAGHGLKGHCYASVADGLHAAKAEALPGDTIFIGGSTFVVADMLAMK